MSSGYKGQADVYDQNGQFNAQVFLIQQLINKCNTTTLVKIIACTNSGGVSPVGFVDIKPLVKLIDGAGNPQDHKTIYHCLYYRMQGGTNAVIMDPQPGDIGICCFADRDISSVKANKKESNPGSNRRFDYADGIYLGGVLNGTPSQYVQYNGDGITVHSPTKVKIEAPVIEGEASTSVTFSSPTITLDAAIVNINAQVAQAAGSHGGTSAAHLIGPLTVDNDVTAGDISLENHVHDGVDPGEGTTGVPV